MLSPTVRNTLNIFKKSLLLPNGKDSCDSLFYPVCYAVRYEKTKKTEKCSDEELKNDLPNNLFLSLDSIRLELVVDLDYQNFEK